MDIHPLSVLINLAGAVGLLVWAVRLVRTGVERVAIHHLRAALKRASASRFSGAGAGVCLAVVMQSSTAVALMVAGFLKHQALAPVVALVIVLGADLGSALVSRLLVINPDLLASMLLALGVGLFLKSTQSHRRQVGRILIGLSLIFLSLDLISSATAPLRDASGLAVVAEYLEQDLLTAFLLAAVMAWLMHSSVAAVLLIASLAMNTVIGIPASLALVLGANLGGALIAAGLTLNSDVKVRRVMMANVFVRGGGAVSSLWVITLYPDLFLLSTWGVNVSVLDQVIGFHIGFNACVVLIGLALAGPILSLVSRLLPDQERPVEVLSALDENALCDPDRALSCARREVLRIGEEVEAMLRLIPLQYTNWEESRARDIEDRERRVDSMHFQVKLYLSRLDKKAMTKRQFSQMVKIVSLAGHFEVAGDEVSGALLGLARRMKKEDKKFTKDGWAELEGFHDRVLVNAQRALDLLMRPERDTARALLEEKESVRTIEIKLQKSHLKRLQKGVETSVETSNLHQGVLRSLKQVNASMAMAAYPVLEETGDLLESRLVP